MKNKTKKVIDAIKEYQVSGCVNDFDENDIKQDGAGVEWSDHCAGTIFSGIGRIFLGMPKSFSRMGARHDKSDDELKINIFVDFKQLQDIWEYDKFNVPCWKYINEKGHTFVRGLSPRINKPFLHIILEDCIDKIDCIELTEDDIEGMD